MVTRLAITEKLQFDNSTSIILLLSPPYQYYKTLYIQILGSLGRNILLHRVEYRFALDVHAEAISTNHTFACCPFAFK